MGVVGDRGISLFAGEVRCLHSAKRVEVFPVALSAVMVMTPVFGIQLGISHSFVAVAVFSMGLIFSLFVVVLFSLVVPILAGWSFGGPLFHSGSFSVMNFSIFLCRFSTFFRKSVACFLWLSLLGCFIICFRTSVAIFCCCCGSLLLYIAFTACIICGFMLPGVRFLISKCSLFFMNGFMCFM